MPILIDLNGQVARRCADISAALTRIAGGNYDVSLPSDGGDPLREIVEGLHSLQAGLREQRNKQEDEFLRLQCALQNVSTNIMIADNEFRIVYMNRSIENMFQNAAADIRKQIPGFDPTSLSGRCIDEFHRDPAHQRRILSALQKDSYKSRIAIGGRSFDLSANAVYSDAGERIGTVVEWDDCTAALLFEGEQQRLSAESARLLCAVDNVSTNIMIADNDFRIVFLNRAVQKMFEEALVDIRKDLPHFDPKALLGTCIDDFHKRAQHQRDILSSMRGDAYKARISIGGRFFDLAANAVFSDSGDRIGTVVEWYDCTADLKEQAEEERRKAEMLRIKTALDNVSTNTMLADENMKIVYMNKAILDMFRVAEKDIQKDLPNMHVERLLGTSIDEFHKVPAHQRRILGSITDTHRSEVTIGGRTFVLSANAIMDEKGARHGAVVEWVDRTAEVQVEKEVGDIVSAASGGDFSQRIILAGKDGFFHALAASINTLIDICEMGLGDVMRVLAAFSRGDLTERIEADYGGMFGQLKDDANATSSSLQMLIQQIKTAVDAVKSAAEEIAAGNADLSQRTEEQASSLEETASSMEELTATVRQSAENARQANQLGLGARDVAIKGGDVVEQVVVTMSAINDSSRKIVEIISVIDGIAFQTNILALNAAVEAARAGEQGRGFAVVAGEVRNLAQRSAAAAKEIKTLIGGSVEKVEGGTRLVQQAGTTMKEIVDSVKRVTELIGDIAQASLEQSSGIEQVNKAVMQMDQITQQNAAVVEEAAAAAVSLEEQARSLAITVGTFRVDGVLPLAGAPATPALALAKPAKNGRGAPVRRGAKTQADADWKTF